MEFLKGSYVEAEAFVYNKNGNKQGSSLWMIIQMEEKKREGVWIIGKFIVINNNYLS